jgi:hypothetical protein
MRLPVYWDLSCVAVYEYVVPCVSEDPVDPIFKDEQFGSSWTEYH